MAKFEISRKAIADLEGIWDYTVQTWSEEQAIKYYDEIRQSIIDLSNHPDFEGRSIEEIKPCLMGYNVGRHIVFYTKREDDVVRIVRILHERMDFLRHF